MKTKTRWQMTRLPSIKLQKPAIASLFEKTRTWNLEDTPTNSETITVSSTNLFPDKTTVIAQVFYCQIKDYRTIVFNYQLLPLPHTTNLIGTIGKRRNGNKRRQPNEKKGQKKGPKRPKENHITYRTSSPLTDQFNQAVDEMLQRLSNSTIKESRHGNVTLHLKVA